MHLITSIAKIKAIKQINRVAENKLTFVKINKRKLSVWNTLIPVFRMLRQENHEFEPHRKTLYLKNKNNKTELEIRGWSHERTLAEDLSSTPGIHFRLGSDVATTCLFLTGPGCLSLHVLCVSCYYN